MDYDADYELEIFYGVIVDEGKAQINYHAMELEIETNNVIVLV